MRIVPISENVDFRTNFKSEEKDVKVTDVPINKERALPENKKSKLPLVTAAVAVASLGVSIYALRKNSSATDELGSRINEALDGRFGEFESKMKTATDEVVNGIREKVENLSGKIDGVNIDSKLNAVDSKMESLQKAVTTQMEQVANRTRNIVSRHVEVNGQHLMLATTLHGYGPQEETLSRTLQTESARRILGAAPLLALPAGALTMRFVTSEFSGFAKTGGMAAVPQELVANFGAYLSDRQPVNLVADMPMYLGPVENNKEFKLVPKENGNYDYASGSLSGDDTSVMAEVELIGEFPVEMYDDYSKSTETVRMFRTVNELEAKVDFDNTLAQLRPEVAEKVKEALEQGKQYRVGPLLFKPEVDVNKVSVKVGDKENISINYEGFLSLFTPEAAQVVRNYMDSGNSVQLKDIRSMLTTIRGREALKQMRAEGVNPAEYKSRLEALEKEPVQIFRDGIKREDFAEIIANAEDAALLREYMNKTNIEVPDFKISPKSAKSVVTKYKTVFYDNKRFRMDGPFDKEENKTIYNDKATNSGETERFLALSKFFYEHLMPSSQTYLNEPMRADVIIGNDWQTGGIAAMLRYLTPARQAHGLNARFAERLQNTPVMTLMHNFKLRGAVYHSQEKLLNMMFGEHAAKIVENAYAPNGAELSPHLLNTLFTSDGINPQTMAMNFSDYVPFVSVGNFTEASTEPARGGLNYELAALRGRQGKYSDPKLINRIAAMNDIDAGEISSVPTAGGITNGCDRINNIISKEKARAVEMFLGLETGSLMTAEDVERLNAEGKNGAYIVHQNNKRVNLERVVDDIKLAKETNGAINPMKLMDIENTDLTGVDENTMVVGMAGRIVDQKGVDIEAAGILEYYRAGNFDPENPPVFYIQGTGNMKYIQPFLNAKAEVAKINKRAADRMVFANLFSEPGRYDACKMFSDFSSMPSWDEPCGLVHKEIAYASGAIPIVNKTGGLRDGLFEYGTEGENAIFVDFKDKDNNPIEEALPYNAQGFARGFVVAQEWYRDNNRFEKGIEASYNGHYDWLGGKIQQYVEILKQRGVIKE